MHRVRGAILLYLNVAALFAIAFGFVVMSFDGAFAWSGQATGALHAAGTTARFTYFTLATITTTGYGDVIPVHPLARSLANLEAVFGQLFPATLLARLVSQHIRHEEGSRVEVRIGDRSGVSEGITRASTDCF